MIDFERAQLLLDLTSKLRELGPAYKALNQLAVNELADLNRQAEEELGKPEPVKAKLAEPEQSFDEPERRM